MARPLEYRTIRTKSTYEASFYMLYGGVFVKVRSLVLNERRAKTRGYKDQWTITIDRVPQWAIDTWRTGQAYGNITEYVDVRNKLKKKIKDGLRITSKYSYQN